MRTIFIGDVHGCLKELELLLQKITFQSDDRLIFVGDLINKGPDSLGVLDFVIEGKHECILGNHELGFLKTLEDPSLRRPRFDSLFEAMGDKREHYISWMKGLPLYIEEDDFICIHGGIEPGKSLREQKPEVATRIRTWGGNEADMDNEDDQAWFEFYQGKKPVIFGHWALRGLVDRENVIGIDTGCVWGGELTAFLLETKEFVQVSALKQYKVP